MDESRQAIRQAIDVHNAPYVRCMEEGETARGHGGLVLAQAGQPLRHVMVDELPIAKEDRVSLRKDIEQIGLANPNGGSGRRFFVLDENDNSCPIRVIAVGLV
jgi:hypothetical protein